MTYIVGKFLENFSYETHARLADARASTTRLRQRLATAFPYNLHTGPLGHVLHNPNQYTSQEKLRHLTENIFRKIPPLPRTLTNVNNRFYLNDVHHLAVKQFYCRHVNYDI